MQATARLTVRHNAPLIPAALATGKVELRPRCMAPRWSWTRGAAWWRRLPGPWACRGSSRQRHRGLLLAVERQAPLELHLSRFPGAWPTAATWWEEHIARSDVKATRLNERRKAWPWLDGSGRSSTGRQDFYLLPDDKRGTGRGLPGLMWGREPSSGGDAGGEEERRLQQELRSCASTGTRDSGVGLYAGFLPTDGTYVAVDQATRDKHGIPVAAISWRAPWT